MQATTKTLGRTISHLITAIEEAKQQVEALQKDPDLRNLNEDFRAETNMGFKDFVNIEEELSNLKIEIERLRLIALVRDIDHGNNQVDSNGKRWTDVVAENAHFRMSIPAIKSVRETFGLTLEDAKRVIELKLEGLL